MVEAPSRASAGALITVNRRVWSWAVSVTWLEDRAFVDPKRGDRPDYRELLPAAEFTDFARLRAARKAWAERDGVPPYVVFTNEQRAAIAQRRVTSLAALGDIGGVAKAKFDKYGRRVLALVRDATVAEREVPAADPLPESPPQPSASRRPAGRGPTSRHATPVASKSPNVWRLYDMLGNVWEWCEDARVAGGAPRADAQGPVPAAAGPNRVLRRGARRPPLRVPPGDRCASVGFRLS